MQGKLPLFEGGFNVEAGVAVGAQVIRGSLLGVLGIEHTDSLSSPCQEAELQWGEREDAEERMGSGGG